MATRWFGISGIAALLLFDSASASSAAAQFFATPATQNFQGIPYISGGIGLDEREALREVGRSHNLWLEFAQAAGNYVSDLEVVITNSRGETVLAATSQGPWFFTTLPPGNYRVSARAGNRSIERSAQVSAGKQTRVVFSAF